jgi:hypothetical protein
MTDVPDPQPPAPEANVDQDRSTIWLAIEAGVYGPGRDKRPAAYEALERFAARLREAERERDEWEQRYDELLSAVGGVWPG